MKKGNSSKFQQESWVHPYIAIQLAQWVNPNFAIQEKSTQELELKYQEQIQSLQLQLTQANEEKFKIMHKYNSRLQRSGYALQTSR